MSKHIENIKKILISLSIVSSLVACQSTQKTRTESPKPTPLVLKYTSKEAGTAYGESYIIKTLPTQNTVNRSIAPKEAYSIALNMLKGLVPNAEKFTDSSLSIKNVSIEEGNYRVYSIWFKEPQSDTGITANEIMFWIGLNAKVFQTVKAPQE